MTELIHKAGLLVVRGGRLLLCRKREGTSLLILPGGRVQEEETPEACLVRELREELGDVSVTGLYKIGDYSDVAGGEPHATVRVELFGGEFSGDPKPSSEIAELVWFGPDDDIGLLSPSLRNRILPDLIRRGLLPWPRT